MIIPTVYKEQSACRRRKSTLAASSSLVGVSPFASSFLPVPLLSRRQVRRSFSGADLAAGKAFEAAGLLPGNESYAVSLRRCPKKPYSTLYTVGKIGRYPWMPLVWIGNRKEGLHGAFSL